MGGFGAIGIGAGGPTSPPRWAAPRTRSEMPEIVEVRLEGELP